MTATPSAPLPGAAVDRKLVEALHDIGDVLSLVQSEFSDRIDRAALRDAQELIINVAIKHDEIGRYGIYPTFGAEADFSQEDAA